MRFIRVLMAAQTPTPSTQRERSPLESSQDSPSSSRSPMNTRHPLFRTAWSTVNVILVISILLAVYSVGWEYSTRKYLKGFSDAIVPASASPEEKIEAILNWMSNGPARQSKGPSGLAPDRDPTETLNYSSLLQVCGTATNAFINLADSGGLAARRLLLLDSRQLAKHVVAEVLVDGRWIIVDPAFRVILRGANGMLLTRKELADPAVFASVTASIPGYSSDYTYDHTAHIRMSRIRFVGMPLRRILDRLAPGWEDSTTISLLVERKSLATMVAAILLVLLMVLLRLSFRWYGERRLGMRQAHLRQRLLRAWGCFFNTSN